MRSSSVIIFSRVSDRTRAISTTSDTGLVRKSSAPASRPRTRSDGLVERGDDHHRNEMRRRIGLQAAADLEAVHVRHHHVEQHDIAFAFAQIVQRLGAVRSRSCDIEILGRQPRFEQLHVGGNVVDNQIRGRTFTSQLPRHKTPDCFNEFADRDRLRQISFAAAFADALFVALHRKRGDGHDRESRLQASGSSLIQRVTSRPDTSGSWMSIRIKSGRMLAHEVERLDAIAGARRSGSHALPTDRERASC